MSDLSDGNSSQTDPFLMAVLSSRIEAIIREMINTVTKASRSAVIKNATRPLLRRADL